MSQLIRYIGRHRLRPLLIILALALLVLNMGRWALARYEIKKENLENKTILLSQYKRSVGQIDELRKKVQYLERQKNQLNSKFFSGESEEQISSAMQIQLQEMVLKSGMESESIRPIRQAADKNKKFTGFSDIVIKARLNGTLNQFMNFIAQLYNGSEFFKLESFALKPYRKGGIKVFLELKGYYKVNNPDRQEAGRDVSAGV